MKKFVLFISMTAIVAVILASCQSKPGPQTLSFVDTSGLAQFQSWKAMNEKVQPVQPIVVVTQPASAPVRKKSSTANKTQSGSMNTMSTHEGKVEKKKGWSKAATYSAIGGGAGIALGAVIHKKNRVVGGAVGGAVLGGLGYLLGRSQDKKDGRY